MRQSVTWRPIIFALALRRHNVFRCILQSRGGGVVDLSAIHRGLWEAEINSKRCVKGAEFQIETLPVKYMD